MNFELTVAESFDSLGHFISHCISIFLTSNSCECPHRLLDLIVKERGSLAAVGCASYASRVQSQAHFTAVAPGRFGPANTAGITFRRVRALPCQRGGIIGTSNFRARAEMPKTAKSSLFADLISSAAIFPPAPPPS
jgi:hypothetical protein